MDETAHKAIAIVGVGAVLPDAPNAPTFWSHVTSGRYCISEVPTERWDPARYYNADPKAPDKTYSIIGGWCRDYDWDPMAWKMPIPPRVGDSMDRGQKWSIVTAREALADYGYPQRALDPDRTAVIFGVAMGGDQQLLTAARVLFPEVTGELEKAPAFSALPERTRMAIMEELRAGVARRLPPITEDAMPGELANIVAGRVAAMFDFRGPNFTTDAACASALAAVSVASKGLLEHEYDAVVTGGSDANMSASTFAKFCKVGALSATGSRPYAEGADGFVMGEGAAAFVLKRLADAERDGDSIYGVIRGVGASSDGKGKGITAPNPVGQKLAVQRAWQAAGLPMQSVTLVEGHGTSTPVGDAVELQVLHDLYGGSGLPTGGIALGSVKSNIGHLKGGAGAAGMLKMALALRHKVVPPSINFQRPNPKIDFETSPFRVNTELRQWDRTVDGVRRGAVSAFGFGGTNFHVVLEEHIPGRLTRGHGSSVVSGGVPAGDNGGGAVTAKAPLRGALVIGGADAAEVTQRLEDLIREAGRGNAPEVAPPQQRDLLAPERLAIDYIDADDLATKAGRALKALQADNAAIWRALSAQGVFRGRGAAPKVAFLYPGQGSQYLNMLASLRQNEPIVAEVFEEADEVMTPLLGGRSLSDFVFVSQQGQEALEQADNELRQTAITQPAVLAADAALTRMLAAYGIEPDMVMGHSLGEYGALTAAGALPLADALEAVSARGREMERVSVEDNGLMMAVFGPLEEIQRTIEAVDGYAVVANINSNGQAVVGGTTDAVRQALALCEQKGLEARLLPVSHAFHTKIVAPASEPLRDVLMRLRLSSPELPLVANVTGDFYPTGPNVKTEMADILGQQVASPVQFVKGLRTLYEAGARVFVEVGPKKALHGFVLDVLGDKSDVVALFTNHPKIGDTASFNHALCGLYAAGLGMGVAGRQPEAADKAYGDHIERIGPAPDLLARSHVKEVPTVSKAVQSRLADARSAGVAQSAAGSGWQGAAASGQWSGAGLEQLGQLFAEFLQRGMEIFSGQGQQTASPPVVITGAAMGIPGTEKVFDDSNIARVLSGEQLIKSVPMGMRQQMLDKNIVRLVKDQGGGRFERIDRIDDVIRVAGRGGKVDLATDFGLPADRLPALDTVTQLAMAAGLEAMRDAGIPLVLRYKTTSTGGRLPDRWMLPADLRDDTGVIFASSFPGYDELIGEVSHYHLDKARRERLSDLESTRAQVDQSGRDQGLLGGIDRRIAELGAEIERGAYTFDRRFIFKVLAMGHSQLAEYIGARGPNTHVNAACASSTHAVSVAEDWIRSGRCRRVIIISGDNVTSDTMLEWFGPGFLSTGAAATDEKVEDAAIPFDRRRHGMVLGMGAAAMVVESVEAAAERGLLPICEVLSTVTSNSAFHGTRLDVEHISELMQQLIGRAERQHGVDRREMASQMLFVSHETYTPARGGSAQAEVRALRDTFGALADQIVVTNTKGLTGHAMGVGIEDVVAIKSLETGLVPPVVNFKEPDPELGLLNLSKGGAYPLRYALRLGAGFGSQIAMSLVRWIEAPDGRRRLPHELGFQSRITDTARWQQWLGEVSGYAQPKVERSGRLLRIADDGPPADTAVYPAVGRAAATVASAQDSTSRVQPAADLAAPATRQAPAAGAIEVPAASTFAVAASVGATSDAVQDKVLAIVSEETGYPAEMLEPDLDLEADLGIDTVKQAEVFATVRETYAIPRDDGLDLRAFATLRSVVQWVYDRRPDLRAGAPADQAGPSTLEQVHGGSGQDVASSSMPVGSLEAANEVPRRIPTPVLRPSLSVCRPTGVQLGPNSRVIVKTDQDGVGKALVGRLGKLGVQVLLVEDCPSREQLEQRIEGWMSEGPIQGVYWLAALDNEGPLTELDLDGFRDALHLRVKLLYSTMRAAYQQIGDAGTFLVAATRLGGKHGYDEAGAVAPLGGAVCGFTKTFKREKPGALVKCVDFESSRKKAALADLLMDETLRDPGVVEVGYRGGMRWSVGLVEEPAPDPKDGFELDSQTVFAVTGAAGSIVSAIVGDLAQASGGIFHLLDLTPKPDPADPDLVQFGNDREGLKRDLFERAKVRGERVTPAQIDKKIAGLERQYAALTAMQAVQAAGGKAHYHCVNLLDADAVSGAVGRIRDQDGRVDVLVHAAGLEISHMLPQKSPSEFDLVFDVKADGMFNLLKAIGKMPLGATVAFSSITGRFGNAGQSDYGSANDLLCKIGTSLRTRRPETRAITIDWTAWGGIGMAARGSIPKMMAQAGIDMLPPAAGIPVVRRELVGGFCGEVVVAKRLGTLLDEWDPRGGLDPLALNGAGAGPMSEQVMGMGLHSGFTVETTLDPASQPFLFDHRIDGTAVLPGVMGIEAFAELAKRLFVDWHVAAVEDVSFLAPFKFYRDEPRKVALSAAFRLVDDDLVADCRLTGSRQLPNQSDPQITTHFTARVRLTRTPQRAESLEVPGLEPSETSVRMEDIYRVYFHGPAYRVIESAWRVGETAVGLMPPSLPANHTPKDMPMVVDPRLIELCFQTAGILEIGTTGRMGLPRRVDRVMALRDTAAAKGRRLIAIVRPAQGSNGHEGGAFDAFVADEAGNVYVSLEGYRTVEMPGGVDPSKREPLQRAMS